MQQQACLLSGGQYGICTCPKCRPKKIIFIDEAAQVDQKKIEELEAENFLVVIVRGKPADVVHTLGIF